MRYSLFVIVGIILLASSVERLSFAQTPSSFGSHVLTGDEIKNNPLAQKILSEIESFKKHAVQIQQDQRAPDIASMQIEHQRELAGQLEQEAFTALGQQNADHTPKAAFEGFVSSVNDTAAQNIFWGEFDYMSQKVDAGNAAMKQVLDNGGTWDQAIQEFSKTASITRADMVHVNEDLNIQYGAADPSVQSNFDSNGMLPVDYVKAPSNLYHR
ncbi:MAG: hypothetical protein KGH88_03580 [Thaumarchaeota archaeon]|nr:hypothetical protein [Nitrososphaerota archaeon]